MGRVRLVETRRDALCSVLHVEEVGAVLQATDDYLRWASSHYTRTPATAGDGLPCARGPGQPKPAGPRTCWGAIAKPYPCATLDSVVYLDLREHLNPSLHV